MNAEPTTIREFLTKTELLAALKAGERIEAGPRTEYAGEAVEYAPRKDTANNHPDCYPWHVIGRPDYASLRHTQVVVVGPAPTAAARPTAFETEFQTAVQAATAATRAASAHIGDLLRDDLPAVAWLLVNTDDGAVDSAYDGARRPVGIPDTEALDKVFDTVSHVLDQVLSLGSSSDALVRNGWELTHPRPFASFPVRPKADNAT